MKYGIAGIRAGRAGGVDCTGEYYNIIPIDREPMRRERSFGVGMNASFRHGAMQWAIAGYMGIW